MWLVPCLAPLLSRVQFLAVSAQDAEGESERRDDTPVARFAVQNAWLEADGPGFAAARALASLKLAPRLRFGQGAWSGRRLIKAIEAERLDFDAVELAGATAIQTRLLRPSTRAPEREECYIEAQARLMCSEREALLDGIASAERLLLVALGLDAELLRALTAVLGEEGSVASPSGEAASGATGTPPSAESKAASNGEDSAQDAPASSGEPSAQDAPASSSADSAHELRLPALRVLVADAEALRVLDQDAFDFVVTALPAGDEIARGPRLHVAGRSAELDLYGDRHAFEVPELARLSHPRAAELCAVGVAYGLKRGEDSMTAARRGLAAALAASHRGFGGRLEAADFEGFFAKVRRG